MPRRRAAPPRPLNVLVTDAWAPEARAVAHVLLRRGHHVHALEGAHESLLETARGVDAAFLCVQEHEDHRERGTRHALDAADAVADAGVEHLVVATIASADRGTGVPMLERRRRLEEHVEDLDVNHTILGPAWPMESLLHAPYVEALREDRLAFPLPQDRDLQVVALRDLAEVVARILEHPHEHEGERFDVASDELTPREMRLALERATGRDFEYEHVPLAEVEAVSASRAALYGWLDRVGHGADINALRDTFPDVPWRTFRDWAVRQEWGTILGTQAPPAAPPG